MVDRGGLVSGGHLAVRRRAYDRLLAQLHRTGHLPLPSLRHMSPTKTITADNCPWLKSVPYPVRSVGGMLISLSWISY